MREQLLARFPAPAIVGIAAVGAYTAGLALAMENSTYDIWGAVLVLPAVIAANAPFLAAAVRREAEPWFAHVIVAAFALKMVASLARYWVAFGLYGGVADAAGYHSFAASASSAWRRGDLAAAMPQDDSLVGTPFLRLITTAVYTLTGPSAIAGFAVFASFGFWGTYLCYRAFRLVLPHGNHRRYALLVLFLPSLLFWPSSIGKEAWLMLCVGAVALGAARFYAREPGAYPVLTAGLLGSAMVRPHVTALAVAGLLAGQLFRGKADHNFPVASKVLGTVALVVTGAIVVNQAAAFLGIEELSSEGVSEAITTAGGHTEQGGSEFTPVPLTSPVGAPVAVITVLFRPFPWEAHNLQALMASIESLVLLGIIATSWRRLRSIPHNPEGRPYLVFAFTYMSLFVYAFSSFGNFGILARQRVLVLPFLLVLAALPAATSSARRRMSTPPRRLARVGGRW